ncbi:MLO-like protein 3 [Morus notabilis]|uniref:MLO-like protein n=1 Tax=Morus notabilis TaxID=981085 RepID=W9RVX6_9ROSA|nr:MLO-like protein 3 [Morus notabilis]
MATGSSSTTSRSLQDTPTWALATWLKKHRKTALFEAVEKLKSVLILLGFMSLLLAVTQRPISKICIPTKVAYTMLPCRKSGPTKTTKALAVLLMEDLSEKPGRRLAGSGASSSDHCESQGKTSFISQEGINQLNNLIFVVAIMQIVYSVLTMALGRAKMRRWEKWEKETQTLEYQVANDPYRFRYTRQTTFARRHMNTCTATSSMLLWIKCFFQQFFRSVAKVDYLTLRHGFIAIVLVLGTKLEVIVARMAHALDEKNNVIIGSPLVQPNDNLFWFGHPKFVLTFLHLTLFMNAFELSFFVWVTWQFGIKSCYHEHTDIIVIRVVLAVTVQLICSYVTLPLYALVTQMGSNFKSAVLEEHTAKAIRQWHEEAKQKRKKNHTSQSTHNDSSSTTIDHTSATNINSISPDHPVSGHHTRSPSFADQISPFSTDNEIVEEHYSQEIGQNTELDQSVALPSSTVQDIKMLGSEEKPING